jgi:NUMOD3 motif
LNDGERLMIRLLRKSSRLYNLTDGGDGVSGVVVSEETRRKMGDASRGKPKSSEHRRKIGIAQIGKVISEETRRKSSVLQKGRPLTGERRQRLMDMNAARRGKKIKTHCKYGHERSLDNVSKAGACIACQNIRNASRG